jgi:hypothetical protein
MLTNIEVREQERERRLYLEYFRTQGRPQSVYFWLSQYWSWYYCLGRFVIGVVTVCVAIMIVSSASHMRFVTSLSGSFSRARNCLVDYYVLSKSTESSYKYGSLKAQLWDAKLSDSKARLRHWATLHSWEPHPMICSWSRGYWCFS